MLNGITSDESPHPVHEGGTIAASKSERMMNDVLGDRIVGLLVFLGAFVLCGTNLYFVATSAAESRWLTVPLLAVLLVLGVALRHWQVLTFVLLAPLVSQVPRLADGSWLRIVWMTLPFVVAPWGL